MYDVKALCQRAYEAEFELSCAAAPVKNDALCQIADALIKNSAYILQENNKDVDAALEAGMSEFMADRLALNDARIRGINILFILLYTNYCP